MSDFNLTLLEACEYLNKSKRSINRYIKRGLLHPQEIKSKQGTLEYRFTKADIEAFKAREAQNTDETRQDRTDKTRQDRTGQGSEVITLLKETTRFLKEQLVKKDEQIKDLGGKIDELIQRNRETNILIGQLQGKILMLEKPKEPIISEVKDKTRQDRTDKTRKIIKPLKEKETKAGPKAEIKPAKAGFWQRLLKKLCSVSL